MKSGRKPGIYRTWDECKRQVDGYRGAVYKGFATEDEALGFLGGMAADSRKDDKARDSREDKKNRTEQQTGGMPELREGEAAAYVDGSYNVKTGLYACGVVFFCGGKEEHYNEKGEDAELARMRNVAGEILGAQRAMEMAVQKGVERLVIYHDYQGIASWCLGEWKTNREGTRAYKEYYDSLKGKLQINFCKVKGHSGNTWNDLADELAKELIF